MTPEAIPDWAFQLALTLVSVLFTFVLRALWKRMDDQAERTAAISEGLTKLRVEVARDCVTKTDMMNNNDQVLLHLDNLSRQIERMDKKLDGKKDKRDE